MHSTIKMVDPDVLVRKSSICLRAHFVCWQAKSWFRWEMSLLSFSNMPVVISWDGKEYKSLPTPVVSAFTLLIFPLGLASLGAYVLRINRFESRWSVPPFRNEVRRPSSCQGHGNTATYFWTSCSRDSRAAFPRGGPSQRGVGSTCHILSAILH